MAAAAEDRFYLKNKMVTQLDEKFKRKLRMKDMKVVTPVFNPEKTVKLVSPRGAAVTVHVAHPVDIRSRERRFSMPNLSGMPYLPVEGPVAEHPSRRQSMAPDREYKISDPVLISRLKIVHAKKMHQQQKLAITSRPVVVSSPKREHNSNKLPDNSPTAQRSLSAPAWPHDDDIPSYGEDQDVVRRVSFPQLDMRQQLLQARVGRRISMTLEAMDVDPDSPSSGKQVPMDTSPSPPMPKADPTADTYAPRMCPLPQIAMTKAELFMPQPLSFPRRRSSAGCKIAPQSLKQPSKEFTRERRGSLSDSITSPDVIERLNDIRLEDTQRQRKSLEIPRTVVEETERAHSPETFPRMKLHRKSSAGSCSPPALTTRQVLGPIAESPERKRRSPTSAGGKKSGKKPPMKR